MAVIDKVEAQRLKRGESVGVAATIVCGAVLAAFIVMFSVSIANELSSLRLITLIVCPPLIAAAAGLAALCNIKYGGALEKLIDGYVRDLLIENAPLLHPERKSLSFYFSIGESSASVKVNDYKEEILFDFSVFKKLSPMRKSYVCSSVQHRISNSFIKLVIQGSAEFTDVAFSFYSGKKKKSVYIIRNGEPDKKALLEYYKNK